MHSSRTSGSRGPQSDRRERPGAYLTKSRWTKGGRAISSHALSSCSPVPGGRSGRLPTSCLRIRSQVGHLRASEFPLRTSGQRMSHSLPRCVGTISGGRVSRVDRRLPSGVGLVPRGVWKVSRRPEGGSRSLAPARPEVRHSLRGPACIRKLVVLPDLPYAPDVRRDAGRVHGWSAFVDTEPACSTRTARKTSRLSRSHL